MSVCPICDAEVAGSLCPQHLVPTFHGGLEQTGVQLGVGAVIAGRYRITRALGAGEMGQVFAAMQLGMAREVAIKVLEPNALKDLATVKRFYREALAVSAVKQPNIVQLVDFGVDAASNVPFLVLELVTGTSLRALVDAHGAMPEARVVTLLLPVARGLVHAHARGLVHRDLKPENLMIEVLEGGEEVVKILDFGLARAPGGDGGLGAITADGSTVGTPRYMSPEQTRGSAVGPASDLYSLGCILHELLTGTPPYSGKSYVETLAMHTVAPVPPLPAALCDGRPPSSELRALHAALLAKAPATRPKDAARVVEVLASIARGEALAPADEASAGARLLKLLRRLRE